MKTTSPGLSTSGFTLVELVVTIAIMSIALLGVAYSLQFSAQRSADPLWQSKTIKLVQAYLDEILTKRYDELTPIGGVPACSLCSSTLGTDGPVGTETRGGGANTFDDVDDYHTLNNKPPIDAAGNLRSEYANYQVEVNVSYAGSALGLSNNHFAKKIEITVTPPGQPPLVFSVYRGNY
ncbi:prepilin-type N-terminal cleavage/methylation domain-containing protein [Motiliproteus sp. MSK22-1]|uniref:type IV pilus modification PilV family protein n=1 Tax=Motiliproteus sp. MSK22-1 TaxID=1897630 RepID=UPI0013015340|nr:type II secretion system protein [Motiliproteus sp. MSK22-1]